MPAELQTRCADPDEGISVEGSLEALIAGAVVSIVDLNTWRSARPGGRRCVTRLWRAWQRRPGLRPFQYRSWACHGHRPAPWARAGPAGRLTPEIGRAQVRTPATTISL